MTSAQPSVGGAGRGRLRERGGLLGLGTGPRSLLRGLGGEMEGRGIDLQLLCLETGDLVSEEENRERDVPGP